LKAEPKSATELARLLAMARTHLADAGIAASSVHGRFLAAYSAAYAAALAALRWHGYRSENRYIVFQCLEHTLKWPPARWRLLTEAHQKRNLAEYEGFLEVEEIGIADLRKLADAVIKGSAALIKTG
jgi:hypothetical protein